MVIKVDKTILQKDIETSWCGELDLKSTPIESLSLKNTYTLVVHIERFLLANFSTKPTLGQDVSDLEELIKDQQALQARMKNPLLYFNVEKINSTFAYYKCQLDGIYSRGERWGNIKDYSFAQSQFNISTQISFNSSVYKQIWWIIE